VLPAPNFEDTTKFLQADLLPGEVKLVGFVIAPPRIDASQQLFKCIDEFNFRFGGDVHFFFAGWSRYGLAPSDCERIPSPDGEEPPWFYSPRQLNEMIHGLESCSAFQWSGTAEIVLLVALRSYESSTVYLDFSKCLILNLTQMLRDGAIVDVGVLLEGISREGRRSHTPDVDSYSDEQGLRIAGLTLLEGVLDRLPLQIGKVWRRGRHFAVRDLSE
jgi:hypothetical protein